MEKLCPSIDIIIVLQLRDYFVDWSWSWQVRFIKAWICIVKLTKKTENWPIESMESCLCLKLNRFTLWKLGKGYNSWLFKDCDFSILANNTHTSLKEKPRLNRSALHRITYIKHLFIGLLLKAQLLFLDERQLKL